MNDLRQFFGDAKPLRDIGEAQAHDFRQHLLTRTPKLAPATAARRLKRVRQFFDHAVMRQLTPSNPFAKLKLPSGSMKDRQRYIPLDDVAKLMAVANPAWRTIIALSRYAGLRCPSEVLSLKWAGINFETGRMVVDSPKTEHHDGGESRVVPIFPLLRPYLEEDSS